MPSQEGNDRIDSSECLLSHMTRPLISQMGLSDQMTYPVHILDSACGTGVLTQELQKLLPTEILKESTFLCADSAESAVSLVTSRVKDEGWTNTEVKQLDVMNTGLPAKSFTHVGIGMGLHIIPDPDAVLADVKRILKPGGIFGASTPHPDSTFWMSDLRSAFASFPFTAPLPSKVPMQLHNQGDWTSIEWIETHLKDQGFSEVSVQARAGNHRVESAEDFIATFGKTVAWFLSMWWDEETRAAHPVEEVKELVKDHLREKYHGEAWDLEWMLICSTGRLAKENSRIPCLFHDE